MGVPPSCSARSGSLLCWVDTQTWKVDRTSGVDIESAESTLHKYSMSADNCWEPRSLNTWMPLIWSMYRAVAPSATCITKW